MSIASAIEGVSRFFQWLYNTTITLWNSFILLIVAIIFIGIQIAFIYFYFKAGNMFLLIYPKIKEIIYKIDRFFS